VRLARRDLINRGQFMPRSALFSVILLAAGAALLIWGWNAHESLASEASEVFQGAPSNKSIILMVVGGVVAAAGIINLFRRAP
jgi:hypothetical protein